jgi:hypothetical protein
VCGVFFLELTLPLGLFLALFGNQALAKAHYRARQAKQEKEWLAQNDSQNPGNH